MKNINDYLRVGTDYYRETTIPTVADTVKILKSWSRQALIDDFGKDAINDIKKYDGFCFIPSHNNFQKTISGHYNRYEPLSYSLEPNGKWDNINKLLEHIFQEQYDLGIDYLTILWKYPTQILPILCLVSEERDTGKTTFLNLLKLLFEGNTTLNTNDDFRSPFNSHWAGKLIIAVDEVLLDRKEDSERIKNLSTTKYFKAEAKGKDKVESEFFGKFVLCSNKEEDFIKTDRNEIRYWIRKIPSLKDSKDPALAKKLKLEIPAFAYFLQNREITNKKVSRMWFSKEQIYTEALEKLLHGNKTNIEKELEEMLKDEFSFFELQTLCYTAKNLVEMLRARGVLTTSGSVATILRTKYSLKNENNSSYKYFRSDISHSSNAVLNGFTTEKGRYFTFENSYFTKDC